MNQLDALNHIVGTIAQILIYSSIIGAFYHLLFHKTISLVKFIHITTRPFTISILMLQIGTVLLSNEPMYYQIFLGLVNLSLIGSYLTIKCTICYTDHDDDDGLWEKVKDWISKSVTNRQLERQTEV